MAGSDEDLVTGCLRRDSISETMLYRKFAPKMYGICLRYAGNEMEANDIMQNGFLRVYANMHRFRNEGSLEGWIRRIVINTAINYNKQRLKFRNEVELKEEYDATIPEETLSKLSTQDLLAVIRSLSPGHRTVFNLYAIEGYGHKEIASMLGITEGTSKSQLHRAKESIRRRLEEHGFNSNVSVK